MDKKNSRVYGCMCIYRMLPYQFDGLPPQFPFVPLVRLDDVGLHEVCVRLCAHVALGHWRLDQLLSTSLGGEVVH